MVRVKRILISGCAALAIASALWAVRVEFTFERNLRRGIPADFRLRNAHRPINWRV